MTPPDAELIRLADAIEAAHAEPDPLHEQREALGSSDRAEAARIDELIRDIVERCHVHRQALAQLPATTMEGFRAKARIVRLFDYEGDGYARPTSQEAMAYSLANDLLGLPTVWRSAAADHAEWFGQVVAYPEGALH